MPNFDERLRHALSRVTEGGDDRDPDARVGDVRSRKHRRAAVRRLQVAALTIVVVAGSVGGTFALAHAFGSAHRTIAPGGAPSGSLTPFEGTPPPSPTPSPTEQRPIFKGSVCALNNLSGDFDGDGIPDEASVFYPKPADQACPAQHDVDGLANWLIDLAWGSGTTGEWPLSDCQNVCIPLGANDLNGDGTADMALQVDMGASTSRVTVVQLNEDERGPIAFQVLRSPSVSGLLIPGFPWGATVTHQDYITCTTTSDGGTILYSTSGVLAMPEESQWTVVERSFSFDPATVDMTLTGEQSTTYPAPSQPSSPPFPVRGDACFPGSNVEVP